MATEAHSTAELQPLSITLLAITLPLNERMLQALTELTAEHNAARATYFAGCAIEPMLFTIEDYARSLVLVELSHRVARNILQPLEPQPLEPQPLEPQPLEPQPLEPQPLELQPLEPQPRCEHEYEPMYCHGCGAYEGQYCIYCLKNYYGEDGRFSFFERCTCPSPVDALDMVKSTKGYQDMAGMVL